MYEEAAQERAPAQALRRVGEVTYEIPRSFRADMRAPAQVIADEVLLEQISRDRSVAQLVNVATLVGVADRVVGMPDMHEGYGFPVGGVAATEVPDGVISPGGIGFDINCGVRLLASNLSVSEVGDTGAEEGRDDSAPAGEPAELPSDTGGGLRRGTIETILHELSRSVPSGYGRHGRMRLTDVELDAVLRDGAHNIVREHGLGSEEDLTRLEAGGRLPGQPDEVSTRAKERGRDQLGTLGGGNHFLEIQRVDAIYEPPAARAFGLRAGQVVVLVHTGSRGLGHQVCSDAVRSMDEYTARRGIVLPDRQLACAPLSSPEGAQYFGAMCAAANFAWANRQVLTHRIRQGFTHVLGSGVQLSIVYDVAHNIAKIERYRGTDRCVHRKGATRALGPSHPEVPAPYRAVGQPVFIPGSMGTASFVLAGTDAAAEISFASACHGAGRAMSRASAKHQTPGHIIRKQLEAQGIAVRCPSNAELAEEAPLAYKDVERVVDVIVRAGIARKVARLVPLAVLKG